MLAVMTVVWIVFATLFRVEDEDEDEYLNLR